MINSDALIKMKTETKTNNIIKKIGDLALEAMLVEVSVTPKPGLVDRNNSGAHSDMDYFTFIRSAASLRSCFENFAILGFNSDYLKNSWPEMRSIGIEAEKKMFNATAGINTHKGEIFSLGLLSACAGYFYKQNGFFNADEILCLCSEICTGLCDKDFERLKNNHDNLTKGERVFLQYGLKGVRGEAESGYPLVNKYALPALKKLLNNDFTLNDALTVALLEIIAHNDDSNIISRHDLKTCEYVKNCASEIFMKLEKNFDVNLILALDQDFITKNISPSGSADLLAVTYFLYSLEKI